MKVYSLATTYAVIENPIFGSITLAGGGKNLGSITVTQEADNFSHVGYADGSHAVTFNAFRGGEVTFAFNQATPLLAQLTDFNNFCYNNHTQSVSKMIIRDESGVIAQTLLSVFPTRIPDTALEAESQDRTWVFLYGDREVSDGGI